jgi:hypothetical protein
VLLYNYQEVIVMGNPNLKNRVIPNSAVDKELYAWLKDYSKQTKIPISKLLDKSIELLKESTK